MPYELPDKTFSKYPPDHIYAKKIGSPKYKDIYSTCLDCGTAHPDRYIDNHLCVPCVQTQQLAALEVDAFATFTRDDAVAMDQPGYYDPQKRLCEQGPHLIYKSIKNGKCLGCTVYNSARERAHRAHKLVYLPRHPCEVCGLRAKRRVDTDTCTRCVPFNDMPNSRMEAMRAFETFYMPDKPCRNGHLVKRYVKSGQCTACLGLGTIPRSLCTKCGYVTHKMEDGSCIRCDKAKRIDDPRERAKFLKEKFYTPREPCVRCEEIKPRNTKTGDCTCGVGPQGLYDPANDVLIGITRDQARRGGYRYYMSDRPCLYLHHPVRLVDTDECRQCKEWGLLTLPST